LNSREGIAPPAGRHVDPGDRRFQAEASYGQPQDT